MNDYVTRIAIAKQALADGKPFNQGCSGLVASVLGIAWEKAQDLITPNTPVLADFSNVQPGDILGWPATDNKPAHVTVYINDSVAKFIDVHSPDDPKTRKMGSYGPGNPLFLANRFVLPS